MLANNVNFISVLEEIKSYGFEQCSGLIDQYQNDEEDGEYLILRRVGYDEMKSYLTRYFRKKKIEQFEKQL